MICIIFLARMRFCRYQILLQRQQNAGQPHNYFLPFSVLLASHSQTDERTLVDIARLSSYTVILSDLIQKLIFDCLYPHKHSWWTAFTRVVIFCYVMLLKCLLCVVGCFLYNKLANIHYVPVHVLLQDIWIGLLHHMLFILPVVGFSNDNRPTGFYLLLRVQYCYAQNTVQKEMWYFLQNLQINC